MVLIRLARLDDIEELVGMRWDFASEEYSLQSVQYEDFHRNCREFLTYALGSGNWFIWVAEVDSLLVAHVYLQLIHKVPKPGGLPDPCYGYVTNVYTRPAFRSQGIGTEIQSQMEQWSKDRKLEFLIVWPSQHSVDFYTRNGFSPSEEAMEKHL